MKNRREFMANVIGLGAGLAAAPRSFEAEKKTSASRSRRSMTELTAPVQVQTPDVTHLPWRLIDGAKEFHLIAEPVKRRLIPGREMQVWGYNGSCPGPIIEVNQGDRVRIVLENRLPESTSIHWHGLEIPVAMDGMPYISQAPTPPGGKFVYEFTLNQAGTFFYH